MRTTADLLRTAVRQWRQELSAGIDGQHPTKTSTWILSSPIYKAACCDADAKDAEAMGCPDLAASWRQRGLEYLTEGI